MKTRLYVTTALVAGMALAYPAASYAVGNLETPTGGVVVGGSSTFSNPNPGTLNVTQTTDRSVINWTGNFNIGKDAATQFFEPNTSSLSVERVTSGNPAQILGTLKSNGNVMILDPNGVLFGKNSVTDVNGLIASTGHVSTDQVMSGGSIQIQNISGGAVENKGAITVADAGLAAFVAPTVRNSGTITANVGKVTLGAGSNATVDFYGDGLLSIAVSGNVNHALVENSGNISAHGGQITLTAPLAAGIVNGAINNTGIVDASDLTARGGQILLTAGKIKAGGTLNASGGTIPVTQPGTGGNITLHSGPNGSVNITGTAKSNGNFGGAIVATGRTVKVSGQAQAIGTTAIGGEIDLRSNHQTVVSGAVDVSGLEGGGTATLDSGRGFTGVSGTLLANGNFGGTLNVRGGNVDLSGTAHALGNAGIGGLIHVTAGHLANVSGTIDATGLEGGGTVFIESPNTVNVSGTVIASPVVVDGQAHAPGIPPGSITLRAPTVRFSGLLVANGFDGGGNVTLTGGSIFSSGDIEANSTLKANGGNITFSGTTLNDIISGTLSATGGPSTGSGGGTVTVDKPDIIGPGVVVNVSAPAGPAGTYTH